MEPFDSIYRTTNGQAYILMVRADRQGLPYPPKESKVVTLLVQIMLSIVVNSESQADACCQMMNVPSL